MAIKWIEGFETRQEDDYYARSYASYAGLTGTNSVAGRKLGSGIQGANMQFETRELATVDQNTWIIQFALRKSDSTDMGANYGTFLLRNAAGSGGDQVEIRWVAAASPDTGSFRFEVRRGTTVLATSRIFRFGSSPRAWWAFQFKVVVRTGTNGSFEMKAWDYLNTPETVFSLTSGVNTANAGVDGADRVFFRPNGGGTAEIDLDDIVIMDGTGSVNNDLTSLPFIVVSALPNADVSGELDWIPSTGSTHFNLVQDSATVPTGTGEVTSDVVGDVDLYGFDQTQLDLLPTASPPAVAGIQVDVEALMKTSGNRTLRVRFKDSTNQADDTTDMLFNDTAKISRHAILEQNPTGTPAAWTVATLKTIELGPKVNA